MKRHVLRILVSLLLGVISTAAMAWGLKELVDATSSSPEIVWVSENHFGWTVFILRRPGALTVNALASFRSSGPVELNDERVPRWSRVRRLPAYQAGGTVPMVQDSAYGWPMLSMWYSVDGERDWETGRLVSRSVTGSGSSFEIPLRPLVPGFLFDAIIYGLVWFILLTCPGLIRRYHRIQRGLCLNCGYDLCGNVVARCPECGWGRKEAP